jgi:hypothetical protein
VAQTQDQPLPPPRRSHGCLWGCLGVILLAVLLGGGSLLWTGWWVYEGFKPDPAMERVLTAVRTNPTAHDVLGDNIKVLDVQSERFTAMFGVHREKSATYTAELEGSKGRGQLHVTLHATGGTMKVVTMILTGPDGTRYNLTNNTLTPSNSSI